MEIKINKLVEILHIKTNNTTIGPEQKEEIKKQVSEILLQVINDAPKDDVTINIDTLVNTIRF